MNKTRSMIAALAATLALAAAPAGAQTQAEWDGLVRVQSQNADAVFLAPGADFRSYTKVMIDPTEASFRQNWVRDYNRDIRGVSGRITDVDAQRALEAIQSGFHEEFTEAYTRAGYQVVTTPGPDVLRLRTGVLNISVAAPDVGSAGRRNTYAEDAGAATLFVEARDSMTGAILGRAVDGRVIDDDSTIRWRTRASNRADFSRAFRHWADLSVEGLNRLRTATPVPAAAPVS
jgi:hypothetical protein